jgi:hypothetical protein
LIVDRPQPAVRRITDAAGDVFEIRAYAGQVDLAMNDEKPIEILVGDLPDLFEAMQAAISEAE